MHLLLQESNRCEPLAYTTRQLACSAFDVLLWFLVTCVLLRLVPILSNSDLVSPPIFDIFDIYTNESVYFYHLTTLSGAISVQQDIIFHCLAI